MLRLSHALSAVAVSAVLLTGSSSQAIKAKKSSTQTFNDDHAGDANTAAPAQPACPTPPPCPQCPACPAASPEAGKVTVQWAGADEPDHHRTFGHWSLAAFSSPGLTLGAGGAPVAAALPILGTRYWLKEGETYDWGIDVGLGLLIESASTTTTTAGKSVSTSTPAPLGFWLHGGMPLALYSGQHYTFELIPELDIAYADASANGSSASSFHFQAGAQVGPEIHFGFIYIPELSIQPTLGLFLSYTTSGTSTPGNNGNSVGTFNFGTQSGAGTLLGVFSGLSVFYYF